MELLNQTIYQHFQQTINEAKQRQTTLINDIETVEKQLESMKRELENVDEFLISHQGGMATIELMTSNNIALVAYSGEEALTINKFPVNQQASQAAGVPPTQQVAPSQQQYAQQPTQQAVPNQPPITQQAQDTFAPPSYPSPNDIAASQAIQGPQIVQGPPPTE